MRKQTEIQDNIRMVEGKRKKLLDEIASAKFFSKNSNDQHFILDELRYLTGQRDTLKWVLEVE